MHTSLDLNNCIVIYMPFIHFHALDSCSVRTLCLDYMRTGPMVAWAIDNDVLLVSSFLLIICFVHELRNINLLLLMLVQEIY